MHNRRLTSPSTSDAGARILNIDGSQEDFFIIQISFCRVGHTGFLLHMSIAKERQGLYAGVR